MIRNLIGNGILITCYASWLQGEYESVWYLILTVALFTLLNNSALISGADKLLRMEYIGDNTVTYSLYRKRLYESIALLSLMELFWFTLGMFIIPTVTCILSIVIAIVIIITFLLGKHYDMYESVKEAAKDFDLSSNDKDE